MRAKRALWTVASGELLTAVMLGVGFVATPLLLRWLGDERFGAVETATAWGGLVALCELGLGNALRPLLAIAFGKRDRNKVRALTIAGIKAYVRVTLVMLCVGLVLLAAITRVVPVHPASMWDLRVGWGIGLIGVVFTPLIPFQILLEANQQGYWINAGLLVQSLLITIGSLILAWAGWGIAGQSLATLLGALVFNIIVFWKAIRFVPNAAQDLERIATNDPEWREIWNLNWPTFAFNLCGRVSFLADSAIVAAFMSPALVVPFYVTQRLAALGSRELCGLGTASWAGLVELHAQGQRQLFNARLAELTRLISILGVACLVPVVAYSHHFVTLWVGSQRYGGDLLVVAAAVNGLLLAIFSLWGWCINGTGQIRAIMPGLVAQTIINVSFSVILTVKLGMVGPVLGTLVGFIAVSSWYFPWLLRRLFETSLMELFKATVLPLISGIPFALMVWWMARALPPWGWIDMGIEMGGAATVYLLSWWLIGLSSVEKELWLQRARALMPRSFYYVPQSSD